MVTAQIRVLGLNELTAGMTVMPELMAAENEKAMVTATHIAEAEIKARTPRKTGRLFSAWTPQTTGTGFTTVGVVGDAVSYAPYVEEDTQPHDITAHGKALMIPVGGAGFGGGRLSGSARAGQQVAFFRTVRHPGTKGKHMAKEGLAAARPAIVEAFNLAAQRAVKLALSRTLNLLKSTTGNG